MHAITADNPRAIIGGNFPPEDEAIDDLAAFARIVQSAAEYIQFRFPNLVSLLAKRAGSRAMGFRKVLVYALRGIVPVEALAEILSMNRKTVGEDQQRPGVWAEMDEDFDAQLEHASQAVFHHVSLDAPRFEEQLAHFVALDPDLRKVEKQRKAHERAALEADAAADALQEKARIRKLKSLERALKKVPGGAAIAARHLGPAEIVKRLSEEGASVVWKVGAAGADEKRRANVLTSALNESGLKEALKLELVRSAEPHLSKATDPQIGATPLGLQVYAVMLATADALKKRASSGRRRA